MQPPRIETASSKQLVGKRLSMSYAQDRTPELFRSFMPHRNTIAKKVDEFVYAVNIFPDHLPIESIAATTTFEKWAVAEVREFVDLPDGMEAYTLPGGLYAVFIHHGPASAFAKTFGYIFGTWLPASIYSYDISRPRFEKISPSYKPDDPNAEEEIWIPIK